MRHSSQGREAQVQASVSGHDEAGLTARGIEIQPAAAVHDGRDAQDHSCLAKAVPLHVRLVESSLELCRIKGERDRLGARIGIERGTFAVAQHDEASSTARGIGIQPAAPAHDEALTARELGTPAAAHDEASLTARGIETGTLTAVHDEASLIARGIELGTPATSHDEATLTARGIEPLAASHDEATLTARGIEAQSLPAVHDEATLITRGIESEPIVAGDTGSGFELPSVDPATAAGIAGGLAGAGLLITAAAFATRRRELGHV